MWWAWSIVLVPFFLTQTASTVKLKCAHSNTTNSEEQVHLKDEDCDSCFSVWLSGPDGTNQVITQGCWTKGIALNCIQDDQCVHNPKLLATQMSKKWSNVSVCCCRGFMCNDNLVTHTKKTFTKEQEEITIPVLVLIAVSLAGVMLAVVLSIIYAAKNRKLRRRKEKNSLEYVTDDCYARVENGKNLCPSSKEKLLSNSPNSSLQDKLPQQSQFSLNHFLFDGVVSEETMKTVVHHLKRRRHTSGGGDPDKGPAEVAGKKFKSSQIHRFQKETKVYGLLNELDHKSRFFLLWYGSYENETGDGGGVDQDKDLLICLELAPLGPLSFFLTANTLDWLQLSHMLLDISRGIALLHNNLNNFSGEGRHVTVCHRDLNTTNILVRADLSCCISNFSHAIVIEPYSKVDLTYCELENESGSVRYLAPELLDGTLNVADLENSLKQVDVYALGLLFWEASRRCRDLYQGVAVPQFELAYEKETMGTSPPPTSEQMRILVAKHKARPLFPEVWKDSNPAIQMLKETITESWEEEGEARLTTCCILERFQIIDTEMQRYKLVSQGPPSVDKSWLNNTQPERLSNVTTGEVARLERSFNNEATTNGNNRKKDNIVSGQRPTIRIQPHQGLNPCLERNYMAKNKHEEETRNLIMGSVKDKKMIPTSRRPVMVQATPSLPLAPSVVGRRSHHNQPIPFLQNNIHTASSPRRKNTNVNVEKADRMAAGGL